MNPEYVTPLDLEERIAFLLEERAEDTKRIAALENKIEELYNLVAGEQTETRNRANQIYMNLKACGKMTRAEVSKLLDEPHPQAAIRAMQECEALHSDVCIQRDRKGRLHIFLKGEALNALN